MSNSSRIKELKKNTLIIAIANLGSKAIAFILAPLYSYYLTTSQYGTMDLITTTVSLLGPLICLDIYEATFRFSSDDKYSRQKTLSNSVIISIPSLFIYAAVSFVALKVARAPEIIVFTGAFMILDAINQILAQYLRGSGSLKSFAISGVVNSVFLLLSNILFLVLLRQELKGWLVSYLVGKLAMLFYCVYKSNIISIFSFEAVDRECIRDLLKYCIPLLPNAMMWWVMNASDRYMLSFFIGTSITGVYAVANKLPSLLSVFERIFYQSFQTSGINDLDNKYRNDFYSKVFNGYLSFLSVGILALLIILKPFTLVVFANEYSEAWTCTSILTVGVLFHALSGNLGSYYVIFKKTGGALMTSFIGAMTNILLNIFLIPYIGMIGAAITTLIGYITTLVVRWVDVKKYVTITLNLKKTILYTCAVFMQLALYYMPGLLSYGIRILIFLIALYVERDMVIKIIRR